MKSLTILGLLLAAIAILLLLGRHAQTCQGVDGFSALSTFFSIFAQINVNGKVFPCYMSVQTRSKSRKQVMPGDEANSNRKLDDILSKMDVLLQAKTEMLMKLSTPEQTQVTVVKDVNELKKSFKDTDLRILELNSDLALRAKQTRWTPWRRRWMIWKIALSVTISLSGESERKARRASIQWLSFLRLNSSRITWDWTTGS